MNMKSRSEHFKLSHYPRLRLKSSSICIKTFFFLPQILSYFLLIPFTLWKQSTGLLCKFKIIKEKKIVTGSNPAQHDYILVPNFICPTLGILNRKISLKQGFITTVISSTSSLSNSSGLLISVIVPLLTRPSSISSLAVIS